MAIYILLSMSISFRCDDAVTHRFHLFLIVEIGLRRSNELGSMRLRLFLVQLGLRRLKRCFKNFFFLHVTIAVAE